MDLGTLLGLLIAFGALLVSVMMEGGSLRGFVNVPAAVLVLGGSVGATMIGFFVKHLTSSPAVLKQAFFGKHVDPLQVIDTLMTFSRKARREGILALESELKNVKIPFLRRGMQLVVDGTSPELVRDILDTELASMQSRHRVGISMFETLGGFAPTLGILGTVMGLIYMLASLAEPGDMGHAIASAFLATLYGVGSANLIFLPIANKLKAKSAEEARAYELAMQGILSVQSGDNPFVVASKMHSFLSPRARQKAQAKERT